MTAMNPPLIELHQVTKHFQVERHSLLKAVDGVSLHIRQGETLGLVGESGCGKSTLGRLLIRLLEASSGKILFAGQNVQALRAKDLLAFRRQAQIIFQDPYSSLNPRMTVADIIAEGFDIHHLHRGQERLHNIYELLELVGLAKDHANRFPHEFSGGQRQRIGIARAIAIHPRFIVCDEPISALDVSIQAQIVNLLITLQQSLGLTYLFIAHDLSMVKHISDRIAVMYLGKLVEVATSAEMYKNPQHPYTTALLSAIPVPDPKVEKTRRRIPLQGDVPSPINPAPGCRFASRCQYAFAPCTSIAPLLQEVEPGHQVACHLFR